MAPASSGRTGLAILFVGHSGAGKSTTTRLWTERENVEVLSDDRIIVRRDEAVASEAGTAFRGRMGLQSRTRDPSTA